MNAKVDTHGEKFEVVATILSNAEYEIRRYTVREFSNGMATYQYEVWKNDAYSYGFHVWELSKTISALRAEK